MDEIKLYRNYRYAACCENCGHACPQEIGEDEDFLYCVVQEAWVSPFATCDSFWRNIYEEQSPEPED